MGIGGIPPMPFLLKDGKNISFYTKRNLLAEFSEGVEWNGFNGFYKEGSS